MGVVGNGGGNRALLQPDALDQRQPDAPAGMMPFDHDQLEQIAGEIGHKLSIQQGRGFGEMLSSNLPRLDANDSHVARAAWDAQLLWPDSPGIDAAADSSDLTDWRNEKRLARLGDQRALFIDRLNVEAFQ